MRRLARISRLRLINHASSSSSSSSSKKMGRPTHTTSTTTTSHRSSHSRVYGGHSLRRRTHLSASSSNGHKRLSNHYRIRPSSSTTSSKHHFSSGPSYSEHLLNRLRNGQITKTEVSQLIVNNEQLRQNNGSGNSSGGSASYTTHGHLASSSHGSGAGGVVNAPGGASAGSASTGSISTVSLGTKANPLFMRRQTGLKELIFSILPFVFIFWILGGFDMVKKSKEGGVGGMFGKNYSEWEESDWEDDDEDDEEGDPDGNPNDPDDENILKKGSRHINKKKSPSKISKKKLENNDKNDSSSVKNKKRDRRAEFFRRLGIKIDDKSDENEDEDEGENDGSIESRKNKKRKKQKRVRFRDVCGCEEAKLDLQDLVDYLKNPEKYQEMGCKLPKGVLLAGPPGTGKTLLARALAGEAQVPFLATNGASFDEIFVGVGVMRVRKLFERAKEKSPCIVFIDEIDAIANTRMQMGTAHSSDSLNALLSEMDGFEKNSGIIVIAATNMPDRLDAALVRPGRFDRKVHVSPPDKEARAAIVRLYLKHRAAKDVDIELLVSDVAGFSGAELESMVNLASIEAVKLGQKEITMANLVEAKEIISMGRAKKTMKVSDKVRHVTAYHESGHAIVSLYTKGARPIYKATVLPRGQALGFVASTMEDEFMSTKEALLAQLDTCMGGRAAEEIFGGSDLITTGASSDFHQATRIATAMVCQYGMSDKIGKVFYRVEDIPNMSPELQNLVNSEVKRLLDDSYNRAKELILDHSDQLELLAHTLLEKETLSGDEIRELIEWSEDQKRKPIDFAMLKNPLNHLIGKGMRSGTGKDGRNGDENGGNGGGNKSAEKDVKDELKKNPLLSKNDLLNPM